MRIESLLSAVRRYIAAEEYLREHEHDPAKRKVLSDRANEARAHARNELLRFSVMAADRPIKRILVPVDHSQQSRWAAQYAARLARTLKADIALGHIISNDQGYSSELGPVLEPMEMRRKAAKDLLAQAARELPLDLCVEQLISDGDARAQIVSLAEDWGADLVVMGTHARGHLATFILGSTAEHVIRHCSCPVLTIAHPAAPIGERANPDPAHAMADVT